MKRREFFKSLGALLFGASAPSTMALSSAAYVPLPDGHLIAVAGSVDDKAIAQLRAELAQAQKEQMAALQRAIGQMQGRWSQRYGT